MKAEERQGQRFPPASVSVVILGLDPRSTHEPAKGAAR
ncbi:hypothetical protein USDA257_c58360 [Sinorhizobium fredii USDA 257]|uniref:Uncharacterized protein n=1 Tax=Sinorhizobium fredii (strain USDA 257) TaxID=1185652 RepID=I3XEP1_SINF2|nr:hypothetical protein USDA257_c58360 [Sinorhizobium fredii USDA 257]